MLVIRKQQLEALEAAAFKLWMCAHVREHFPSVCVGLARGQLDAAVEEGMRRAGEYGFSSQAHMAQFIDVMLLVGEQFPSQQPWAVSILESEHPHDLKIEQLVSMAEGELFGA